MLDFVKRLFDKKRAKPRADLGHAKEHFAPLVAEVKDYAIFLLNAEGNVLTWNVGAERIKGYRAEEIVGQHFSRFYPKDALIAGLPGYELQQAAETGRFQDEGWRLRKDGSRFWANVVITAIRGEGGAVSGFLKITRDLTERKHAEEKLRLSEERFRILIEGVQEYAIYMLDTEGRVATWNAGAARVKGYSADEVLGEHFSRFYSAEDVASRKPERELAIAGASGTYEEEGWRVRKDGSRFWASATLTALRDRTGVLQGFAKVTRDMTLRKQAEDDARRLAAEEAARRAAEASAAQLHVTLSSIGDAVIVTDAEGIVTFLNPVAQQLTGWSQQQAAGQPLMGVFHIVDEETRLPAENPVSKVLEQGLTLGLANHTLLIARDGTERPIDDSAAPITDSQRRITGVVLVFRDVTERRLAERAQRDADRRKDEFLAMLSHELRNPLAPIQNALHVMKVAGADAQAVERARQIGERQLRHLVRLVDDLLDVSRIMLGRIQLRKQPLQLNAVISNVVEMARHAIDENQQHLIVSTPAEPVWVEADPTRLVQVLANLVNNAAKFSQPKGRIWLTATRDGDEAVVSVRDEGVGISSELLPQVFDLFVQGNTSLERNEGGLGIGLTLVRKLVELHGGSVTASSDGLGKGSEFVLRLPALREAPELHRAPEAEATVRSWRPQRILVVDDNADAAESIGVLLRLWGHEVQLAHTGPEALRLAAAFRPQVVLLDIGLPVMDGYHVAKHLQQDPASRNAVLIALTGYGQENDRRLSREAGFSHHLTKPVEPEALQDLLASLSTQGVGS